jgi:hypothetical protein
VTVFRRWRFVNLWDKNSGSHHPKTICAKLKKNGTPKSGQPDTPAERACA